MRAGQDVGRARNVQFELEDQEGDLGSAITKLVTEPGDFHERLSHQGVPPSDNRGIANLSKVLEASEETAHKYATMTEEAQAQATE